MSTASSPPDARYLQKWRVMTAVAVAIFLGTVDGSIVNIALPTIVDDFDTSFAAVQWVPLSYLLTQATLVLGMGRLGDIAGRKAIFVAGFVVFTIGSVLCGLAPGVGWLIAFRVLQGVGSALIFSMQFALVTESFPPQERGKALGLIGTIVSTGIISGPIIGGIIIDAVDWRWIFYVNLPIGIAGILAALRYLPHSQPGGGERFDLRGGMAFFVALLCLLLGLTLGQERGFGSAGVVALYVISAGAAVWFLRTERRVEHPIVDLRMFRSGDFSVSLATRFTTFASLAGVSILLPFYLTDVLGLAPLEVGLAMTALPLLMGSSAPFAGAWSDRNGVRPVAMVGLVVLLIGFAAGAWLLNVDSPIWVFVLVAALLGLGFGTFQSPNNSAIMGSVPPERLGVASSLITVTRTTGWITGIAVLGTVWAARTASYAGGGEAEDAPAAAQADGLGDVLIASTLVVLATVVLLWFAWRGRWDATAPTTPARLDASATEESGTVPNLDSALRTDT